MIPWTVQRKPKNPECKQHGKYAGVSIPAPFILPTDPTNYGVRDQERSMLEALRPALHAWLQRNMRAWPTCAYGTVGFQIIPNRQHKYAHAYWSCSCVTDNENQEKSFYGI